MGVDAAMGVRRASVALAMGLVLGWAVDASAWRSRLYPESWTPGFGEGGRFLHDFSYAGYHRGEAPIPSTPPGATIDATEAPYGADRSGAADATAAIQGAIDAACAAGGGVVHLPEGTYRLSVPEGRTYGLLLSCSGVVIRGDGPGRTRLFNASTTTMRTKSVIWVGPRPEYYAWQWGGLEPRMLTTDARGGDTQITVGDAAGYAVGELVVVQSTATDAFIAEHGMTGTWNTADTPGPAFLRRITAIAGNTVTLDVPIRYDLKTQDAARMNRPELMPVREVGIEHLSIGNAMHTGSGFDTRDYQTPGRAAYDLHASFFIYYDHVEDGWIRDVHSYRPPTNGSDVHFLSNAVRIDFSRQVTLEGLVLANPQYEGAGGNGYLITLTANDTLVTGCEASGGRHNYSLSFMHSSGNVIHRSVSRDPRLPADFHQRLAFANLFDDVTLDRDLIEMVFRDCCSHGHSTTQSVVWNANGLAYPRDQFFQRFIVDTQQYGNGYVIGTRGAATEVRARTGDGTSPADLVEGEGMGATLEPQSLYLDQVGRRLGIDPPDPTDAGTPTSDGGVVPPRDGGSGSRDGGVVVTLDGSPGFDGGSTGRDGGVVTMDGGCSAGGSSPGAGALFAFLLLGLLRRRA